MTLLQLLQQNDWLFYSLTIFIGLAFGSFLNVVIYRLPLIMEKDWRQQCHEFLQLQQEETTEKFNIAFPASSCPSCGHNISFW